MTAKLKKGKLKITEFTWFKITRDDPVNLYARASHNILQPWQTHPVFPPNLDVSSLERLPPLYSSTIPITKEKKKYLMNMIQFVDEEEHREFYRDLQST